MMIQALSSKSPNWDSGSLAQQKDDADKISSVVIAALQQRLAVQSQEVKLRAEKTNIDFTSTIIGEASLFPIPKVIIEEAIHKARTGLNIKTESESLGKLLNIVDSFLITLATASLYKKLIDAYGHSGDVLNDDGSDKKYKEFFDFVKVFKDNSNEDEQLVLEYFKSCMANLSQPIKNTIIENALQHILNDDINQLDSPVDERPIASVFLSSYASHVSPTLLLLSAYTGDVQLFKRCVDAGIDPNCKNVAHFSPFHIALAKEHIPYLEVLIEYPRFKFVDCQMLMYAETPILRFVNTPRVLNFLMASKLQIQYEARAWGKTPLQSFIEHYQFCCKDLIDNRDVVSESDKKSLLEEIGDHLIMIETLISKNPQLLLSRQSNGRLILEELYLQMVQEDNEIFLNHKKTLFSLLFKYLPIPLSPSIIQDIELRTLRGDTRFLELHPDRSSFEKKLKEIEIPSNLKLLEKMNELSTRLQNEMSQFHLVPEEMSILSGYEAHLVKKQAKGIAPLADSYKQFCIVYDQFVSLHPVLSEVREVSREIRSKEELPEGLFKAGRRGKLLNLWTNSFSTLSTIKNFENQEKLRSFWKIEGDSIRKKIGDAQQECLEIPYSERFLALAHGTNSAAWPILCQTGEQLMPSGELFKKGIAPLTGVAYRAVDSENRAAISVLNPSRHWDERPANLPATKRSTNFLINESYATRNLQPTDAGYRSMIFNPKEEGQILNGKVQQFATTDSLELNDWFDLRRAIFRLRETDKKFVENTLEAREIFFKAYKKNIAQLEKKDPDAAEMARDCFLEWTKASPIFVDASHPLLSKPMPLIFAATYEPTGCDTKSIAFTQEVLVSRLSLRKDLQHAFTRLEDIPILHPHLEKSGLSLHSFEAGHYLEMLQMCKAHERSYKLKAQDKKAIMACAKTMLKNPDDVSLEGFFDALEKTFSGIDSSATYISFEDQFLKVFTENVSKLLNHELMISQCKMILDSVKEYRKLATNFHRDILPYYAVPVSENPYYWDEAGNKVFLIPDGQKLKDYQKTLQDHNKKVADGVEVARPIHGAMHSARVTLFSLMFANFLGGKSGLTVSSYNMAITGAKHDSARQWEFTDHWDAQSARNLSRYLKAEGAPEEHVDILTHALSEKDPKDGKFISLEQRVIHNADCLDIMRLEGIGLIFDPTKLAGYDKSWDPLIEEAHQFIKLTENLALKLVLEKTSQDYLTDVAKILCFVHEKHGSFPLLYDILKQELAALGADGAGLSEEIQKTLA
jgi:hypothetical protein